MKKKTIKGVVNVTAADIKKGTRRAYSKCPIALAVARKLRLRRPTVATLMVLGSSISVKVRDQWYRQESSLEVSDFISHFDDQSVPVKPFKFTMKLEPAGGRYGQLAKNLPKALQ